MAVIGKGKGRAGVLKKQRKTMKRERDSWEEARKYLSWAFNRGFSKTTLLLITHWHRFRLSRQDRRIIRGLILNYFKKRKNKAA